MRRLAVVVLVLVLAAVGLTGAFLVREPYVEPPIVNTQPAHPLVAKAIEEALDNVRQHNGSAEAWGRLGMVLVAHDFDAEARAALAEAARRDPVDFRWPYLHGYTWEEESYEKALELYRVANQLNPDHLPGRIRVAQILLRKGEFAECTAVLDAVLEADPQYPYALVLAGQLELHQGRLDAARDLLNQAAAVPGWSPWLAYHELVTVAVRQGRLQEAFGYRQKLETYPDVARLEVPDPVLDELRAVEGLSKDLAQQADFALARGDARGAIAALQQFLEQRQDLPTAHANLARAYSLNGQHADAIATYEELLKKFGDNVRWRHGLALAFQNAGESAQAREECRKALALKSNDKGVLFLLGMLEEQAGNVDAAVDSYRAAVLADPTFPQAQLALGVLLLGERRLEEARTHIQRAAQLVPGDPFPQKYLKQLKDLERQRVSEPSTQDQLPE